MPILASPRSLNFSSVPPLFCTSMSISRINKPSHNLDFFSVKRKSKKLSQALSNAGSLSERVTWFPVLHSLGRQENNASEDTDDMFDDLLEKYGKVVYRSNDQKPPSAEADDDAESLSFVVALAKVASEVKAADIRVLFVKPLVYWTRFFIIVTAFSRPQIDAIGSKMRDLAEKQYSKVSSGDTKPNSWTLLDFGDVVVHIFLPPQRAFYNLEEFYANATLIELPFENQSSF